MNIKPINLHIPRKRLLTINVSLIYVNLYLCEMESKIEGVLRKVATLLLTYGVKSLTMNDVAARLGISKKTLYTYVKDKNDMVHRCMELRMNEDINLLNGITNTSENAISALIEINRLVLDQCREIHPLIFFELEKYYPITWVMLNQSQYEEKLAIVRGNLKRGIKEGYFRSDFNIEIIARSHMSLAQDIVTEFQKIDAISLAEYYKNIIDYHIRGVASEKGLKYINTNLNKSK